MRAALIVALFLACVFATSNDVSVAESTSTVYAQRQETLAWLRLKLKVVGSQYCVGDDELDRLDLKTRFVYENRGSGPIIVYKTEPAPKRVMVARNLTDAAAGKYELDFTQTWYSDKGSDEGSDCYKGAEPTTCFVVVAAGSSYETDGVVSVLAVRDDTKDIAGAMKSGEHVLELVVPTWDESTKLAQDLAGRWRSHGSLWFQPLTSEPLTFTVDKERNVIECK